MDCAISIGTSIVAKIAEYTVAPVGRQLGYLFCYAGNVDNLKTRMQELKNARDRLQHRVEEAKNNCLEIEADVQSWLSSVDRISEEAETFLNHEGHAKAVCSCGSLPHLVTRHQLSRKAKKMSSDVCAASEKSKFDTISYRAPLESSFAITKGYETFDSRREILESIMAAVRDANRSRIGLYGMGGIGKTMLAKEIAKRAEKAQLFSKVLMTTISQTPNMKEIQQDIAEKLELSFGQTQSMDVRADLLRKRLKQENKILLILDDIWKKLDLEAIGIHDECKMLLTSRYRDVLHNFMGIAESDIFFIKAIDSREAMSLFKKIIGEIVETRDFNSLARTIVDECAGLPIAIATMAYALKNKLLSVWEDALQRLRSANIRDIEGMDMKVYSCIRMSYDFLGSHEEVKSLLLLCALHKEDQEIDVEDLMRYSVGWRLLQGIKTMKEARNRVNSLVDKLKSHCLLLDGRSKNYVKMHDVIRDVCLLIASEDKHRMSNIKSVDEFASQERYKASRAISLLDYDDFGKLPEKLECPRAKLLLLSSLSGWFLNSIPNDFFEQTRELEALGMNGARIKSLPSSFHSLQNLQTLCLSMSNLQDISIIGDLKNLKVLDLSRSSIKRLPIKIGELCHLQLLDLQNCKDLKVIEPNVISNLRQLEELYIPQTFEGWETEEGGMKERRNASLIEIKNLQRLTVLYLSVESEKVLPEGLFSEKLERYQISIGKFHKFDYYARGSSRCLHLNLCQRKELNALGLVWLMKMSEYLSLERLMDVNSFVRDLDRENFPRLKHLMFRNNDGVQYVIDSTDMIHSHHAFPCLESLTLENLTCLERICHGKLPVGSFKELRKVEVWNCDRLKNLFPLSIIKLLHHITVHHCKMMEEIVTSGREDNEAADKIESLQLRSLSLYSLPNFVQFYCSKWKETCASSMIDYSKPLFTETVLFPNLQELTLWKISTEYIWPDQLSFGSFMQNLSILKVESSNSLKYLFSFSLAQKLLNLKKLEVRYCMAMEDIGVPNKKLGEEDTQLENILFPKLDSIELHELSALQRFFAKDSCMEFPLLSKLIINDCQELKIFVSCPTIPISEVSVDHREVNQLVSTQPFFNEKVSLPNLKELEILKLNVVTLWPDQLPSNFDLQNLTSLTVQSCNKIKYLFCFPMVERLVNLKKLNVDDCLVVEEILISRKLGEKRMLQENILFSKLESLNLSKLPVFKTFCSEDFCIKEMSVDDDEVKVKAKHLFNGNIAFPNITSYIYNLKELSVTGCNNLKYLLSSAMTRCLVQLKKLRVSQCKMIEEVIVTEESAGSKGIILENLLLPKLESLELWHLPNVIQFCEGDCIECPSLSTLDISDCPKLKVFVSNSIATKTCTINDKKHEEMELVVARQSLFKDNKVISPNLKYLRTDWSEAIEEIFDMSQSSMMSIFGNLSQLVLNCSSREKPIALSNFNFLQKYHNIDTLRLYGFFVDGHQYHQQQQLGNGETYELVNTSLKTLSIYNAHTMNHLFGDPEYAQPSSSVVFQNLESLVVRKCSRLQSFAPSFMSFHKLKTLELSECHGLTYLFASSTAASLVHLKEMSIIDCKRMREIINRDYYKEGQIVESEHHEFVFQKLEKLELHDLPSLESFYSGNKVVSFPNLEEISLKGCPEMRRFSHGNICTSALLDTIEAEGVEIWEGDFNTTLTKIWEENSDFGLHLQHLFAQEMDSEEDA
ncbi:disease resistance protein At4g27190-like [Humulus lupulus]|uniref:disease resistance protein At4g27190-like n=1 Tax=Humulus lupulus TaxID=3486 RepID=UPI002B40FA0C|nr:disease resistance protein At4g27190-like [Humulus lupulus]XP_062083058.1 disease resistance protein At4g27190-like [Humulus lupulus]XP_062083059.1 disease resistance protein At4g27190-like [Humulus lupulus]XP_062083060.1 disease resistance protein At4g27190-like [Humulus lupulus]XP_062083061.1 disease resistance protein At4g27190-like [Humulus lupulus]XP_062083062.1 disease resistance protein At4g27190-like [Humulus lupulus]XP_062083063.1 disease resistance protein At4g27190-like [Humulus